MSTFLTLAYLFSLGSVFGWGLEVLYRRFLSPANPQRRWINPGFCTGPWVPLYGGGLCILYLLSGLDRYDMIGSVWADRVLMFLAMLLCLTAIEYLAGIVSLKVAKVRLWDYSNSWGNIQGVICPLFSLAWGVLGAAYYFGVHPHLAGSLARLSESRASDFALGIFYGVFLVDLSHSAQVTAKMRAFAREHQIVLRYEDVKLHIRQARERAGKRVYFFFAFYSERSITEHLKEAREAWEARR